MANKLEIPAELAHLIEKREQGERRAAEQAEAIQPQGGDTQCDATADLPPSGERRVLPDRRRDS